MTETDSDSDGLYHKKHTTTVLDEFYITGGISEFEDFLPLISTLNNAGHGDNVAIYISSPGGSVEIGIPLINAMRISAANVTTIMCGFVASMGALIFLAGDVRIVQPHSLLMLHNYSSWADGKAHEIASSVAATEIWLNTLNNDITYPFLNKKEIKQMYDGKDFYFTSEETVKRLEKVIKAKNNK